MNSRATMGAMLMSCHEPLPVAIVRKTGAKAALHQIHGLRALALASLKVHMKTSPREIISKNGI